MSNRNISNRNIKKIDYSIIIVIILVVVFFIVFLYALVYNNNNFIKFRVIKNPIDKIPDSEIDYNKLKNKYTFKKCSDMCDEESICNDYQVQMIKYDLCKECKKEKKCYDQYKGICVECNNKYTCEQLFGCNEQPPINPLQNYCVKCWN